MIKAQINKFGEFVIGVSVLAKPTAIKPNELISTPINVNLKCTNVSGAKSYRLKISKDQYMTDIPLDTN